jgi:hypothetical protein
VLGLVGSGILLIGLIVGALLGGGLPALASSNGNAPATATPTANQHYCQLFMQTLASNLHVSQSQLESATQAALKTTIEQAVKDGKITQDQATKLLNQIDAHPCAAMGHMYRHHDQYGGALANAHQAILSAVAAKLNLSATTLQSDLASGQTLPQIAAAQHVSMADVNAAYLSAVHAQLATAVSSGGITQQQANQAYTKVQQAVASGHYPLLEGRGMHP